MRRAGAAVVMLLLLVACATSELDHFPYRARLYASSNPAAGNPFRSGTVVEKRGDGFLLFKFDDSFEGDHGFMWINPDDSRYRLVRQAIAPQLLPMPADASQAAPDSTWRPPQ